MNHSFEIASESYQQSKIGQWTNSWLVAIRETMLRRIPASILQKKLKKVSLWQVNTWMSDFQKMISNPN